MLAMISSIKGQNSLKTIGVLRVVTKGHEEAPSKRVRYPAAFQSQLASPIVFLLHTSDLL